VSVKEIIPASVTDIEIGNAVSGVYSDTRINKDGGNTYINDLILVNKINGLKINISTKTSDYTATLTDDTILVDSSSNDVTISLSSAASAVGKIFSIKAIDITNTITIDGNGSEIDGDLTKLLTGLYDCITVISDGSNWWII